MNGKISKDPKEISEFCSTFYRKLYASQYDAKASNDFLNSLGEIKKINNLDKAMCDQPIILEEITNSIHNLKNNKSPRTEGLTSVFYKLFEEQLTPFLRLVFCESLSKSNLPSTMTRG